MCSQESLPKEFEKATEVLPFTKYGITSINEFKKAEEDISNLEFLKKVGLTNDEIKLYQDNEGGCTNLYNKIEHGVLKNKLDTIYHKIKEFQSKTSVSDQCEENPTTSKNTLCNIFNKIQKVPLRFYPEGHPMNDIKKIEENLFSHLKNDDIIPIAKRRKILRRLERKKERILSQGKEVHMPGADIPTVNSLGTLWDVKGIPSKLRPQHIERRRSHVIGPKKQTMYTVKDNKIVRLEPLAENDTDEYQAVDIVMPMNEAEKQLLEGTKMSLEDIKKIERFKDYKPGSPSKVLYLKNIAPSVSQDRLLLLFNQFVLENGGPVEIRLMTGRMRGQAFIAFQNEDLAIQALEEINGTILSGRPIIAQFGRNSNRIQADEIG